MSRDEQFTERDYLEHIKEALKRIQRFTKGISKNDFLQNEEKQDAVIRNFEVIGEAAGNILRNFPDFIKEYPDLPIKVAYGMRNALAHGYFKIDLDTVWDSIENDLPKLEKELDWVIQNLDYHPRPSTG